MLWLCSRCFRVPRPQPTDCYGDALLPSERQQVAADADHPGFLLERAGGEEDAFPVALLVATFPQQPSRSLDAERSLHDQVGDAGMPPQGVVTRTENSRRGAPRRRST
jgi:hypothetical protein